MQVEKVHMSVEKICRRVVVMVGDHFVTICIRLVTDVDGKCFWNQPQTSTYTGST